MSLPSNPAHKRDVPSTCLIPLRLTVRSLDIQPLFANGMRSQYWAMSSVSAYFISQPQFRHAIFHPHSTMLPPSSSRASSPHSGQVGCSRPSTPFTGPSTWNPRLIMVLPKVGISPHSGQGSVGRRPCIKNSKAPPDAPCGHSPQGSASSFSANRATASPQVLINRRRSMFSILFRVRRNSSPELSPASSPPTRVMTSPGRGVSVPRLAIDQQICP